jgi:hypothetical protein
MRAIASLGFEGAMSAMVSSIAPHACPRKGRRRTTPKFCAAGANGTNVRQWWSARRKAELAEGISLRGLTYRCANKAGLICSAPLYIFRVVLLLLRQRRGAGLG